MTDAPPGDETQRAADDDDLEDEVAPARVEAEAPRTSVLRARPDDEGKRIEKVLGRCLPRATWGHVARLLRQGRVTVDGRALRNGDVLRGGEALVVVHPGRALDTPPQPNRRLWLEVVHEDPDVVVVVKPPGLTMHPGPGHGTDTLLNALVARFPDLLALGPACGWGLVHRLDQGTSGLLVVARTPAAHAGLVAAFAARQVEKTYLALVAGRPDPPAGEVTTPVDGKEALTRYETREAAPMASLVVARPTTGRTHQIRVHLASRGSPVLGDVQHGEGRGPRVPRLALHATRLAFTHPTTGAVLAFERPLPRDLRRAWKRIAGSTRAG